MISRPEGREPFIHSVSLAHDRVRDWNRYPYTIPAIAQLDTLKLHPAVTFLVGENGSGKSTLMEGMAAKLGLDERGIDERARFVDREVDGSLHDALNVQSSRYRRVADQFFLRAETVFELSNVLDKKSQRDPSVMRAYGSASLHTRSHGEAFLAIVQNRLRSESLFLLDEPEAALSPVRQLTLIKEIDWLVRAGCQFIIATHSPMLLAYPDAVIYEMGDHGIRPAEWKDLEHVNVTKTFLQNPERYLRHLIE